MVVPLLTAFLLLQAPPTWTELGGSASGGGISTTPAASRNARLAVDPDGHPVVAWHEEGVGILVRRWNGATWQQLGGSLGSTGEAPSIAINSGGDVYVAYQATLAGAVDIYVQRWDGVAWAGLGGSAAGAGISNSSKPSRNPAIALDAEGLPWVAWAETVETNQNIYVRRWNGAAWVDAGQSGSGMGVSRSPVLTAMNPALVFDREGAPVLAWEQKTGFADPSEGGGAIVEIYVRRWDGESWTEIGGSASEAGASGLKIGMCTKPILAVDLSNRPVVAWTREYEAPGEVFLRRWNGSAWQELGGSASGFGVSGSRTGPTGEFWSHAAGLALDLEGHPIVTWTEGDFQTYQVRASRWTGSAWQGIEGTDSDTGLGASDAQDGVAPIAVAPSGDTIIAWADGAPGSEEIYLRYWWNVRVSALGQFESDGTPVDVGDQAFDESLIFRGRATRAGADYPCRLQFEVRRAGDAFTGVPTGETDFADAGEDLSLLLANFTLGGWRWRARGVESTGFASAWESFGGNAENFADLWVGPPHGTPAEELPDKRSHGNGCGLLGIEGPLLLGLALIARKRGRSRA